MGYDLSEIVTKFGYADCTLAIIEVFLDLPNLLLYGFQALTKENY
eukprot:NODE_12840_length_222_cov_25.739884_g11070_i0.p2 GENE.NODE_12840_length_222_cov_25.739884_g11070_i0~~NODE_12840_length_222_cov_25.739884_g11070_i0.p2  ORF type:complete len:55 (-),score=23.21 NODE_12840_length_222_cov_25.739884_g11070_i0:58-192(-)